MEDGGFPARVFHQPASLEGGVKSYAAALGFKTNMPFTTCNFSSQTWLIDKPT